jgi:hypothetical protein
LNISNTQAFGKPKGLSKELEGLKNFEHRRQRGTPQPGCVQLKTG